MLFLRTTVIKHHGSALAYNGLMLNCSDLQEEKRFNRLPVTLYIKQMQSKTKKSNKTRKTAVKYGKILILNSKNRSSFRLFCMIF